ncbi:MAG: hypothetical protein SFU27_01580 [Thermonemataceae bacterium]|nr:hypothetical protein [Thermonemataceae bacterium]
MFSFFGKKTPQILTKTEDSVWISTNARFTGLLQEAQIQSKLKNTWVIYFFERTQHQLKEVFKLAQEPYIFVESKEQAQKNKQILVFSADKFQEIYETLKIIFAKEDIFIIFAEHYPLNVVEENIAIKTAEITLKAKISAHTDFESMLLKKFGGARLLELLKKIGIKESESISHPLVSKSIKEAKKKLSEKVKNEQKGVSEEDWFLKNNIE